MVNEAQSAAGYTISSSATKTSTTIAQMHSNTQSRPWRLCLYCLYGEPSFHSLCRIESPSTRRKRPALLSSPGAREARMMYEIPSPLRAGHCPTHISFVTFPIPDGPSITFPIHALQPPWHLPIITWSNERLKTSRLLILIVSAHAAAMKHFHF